eukprot:sb/3475819/
MVLKLVYQFADHGLGIITLQEHRIVHADKVRQIQAGPGETLITSTAWRNSAGASVGGVEKCLNYCLGFCLGSNSKVDPEAEKSVFSELGHIWPAVLKGLRHSLYRHNEVYMQRSSIRLGIKL